MVSFNPVSKFTVGFQFVYFLIFLLSHLRFCTSLNLGLVFNANFFILIFLFINLAICSARNFIDILLLVPELTT